MISARLTVDERGCLSLFEASGHASKADNGYSVLCAAFSALARTAWETLADIPDLRVQGRAEGPGDLHFQAASPPEDLIMKVVGITEFLQTGLKGLKRDFGGQFELVIITERREVHGS